MSIDTSIPAASTAKMALHPSPVSHGGPASTSTSMSTSGSATLSSPPHRDQQPLQTLPPNTMNSISSTGTSSSSVNDDGDDNHSYPKMTPSNSRPNLTVQVDASPLLSFPNGHPAGHLHVVPHTSSWQQPYSELSRFPSASFRFKGKDWPPEGARYMTPLPSPMDTRSRSLSDAGSELSIGSEASAVAPTASNVSSSTQPRGGSNATDQLSSSTPAKRSKTMQFFETMDAAFSPPPPPRITSAKFEQTPASLVTNISNISLSADSRLPSLPVTPTDTPTTSRVIPFASSTSTDRSISKSDQSRAYEPLSNLPSSFRSELQRSAPASSSAPASVAISPVTSPTQSPPLTHRRIPSAGSQTSYAPTVPTALGRHTSLNESPLASPTESQSSRWAKEPPSRLPTLLNEPGISSRVHPTTPGNGSSLRQSSSALTDRSGPILTPGALAEESSNGSILDGRFEVIRNLGLGAFSTVVLAKPIEAVACASAASPSLRKTASGSYPSTMGKGHAKSRSLGASNPRSTLGSGSSSSSHSHLSSAQTIGESIASSSIAAGTPSKDLVAIKMIKRSHIAKNDRMRISIVREVEVLKHIRHPSLVHLTTSFDTPYHTCLVLEYSSGGELFDFLALFHTRMSEALARRIFGELADVLGWMHSIGLVHRDIKLENILLTSRPFSAADRSTTSIEDFPDPNSLPLLPTPFVKLTDFGLSRFIDPAAPYLETRCGSEEYAAPELIMGKRYDGRQTDAWALGVVLYAIITGSLPFVEDFGASVSANASPAQPVASRGGLSPSSRGSAKARRSYLLKIAKGQYSWPIPPEARDEGLGTTIDPETLSAIDATRMATAPVKTLAGALLARDPKNRIRVEDVWDYGWMVGPGAPEKRSVRGGDLDGVSVSEFAGEDERMVRAEVPEYL